MPPTETARIAEIAAKVNESRETHSVPWQNSFLSLPVITLSLDSILLNPKSYRIRAQIESSPRAREREWEQNPLDESLQEIIETILTETAGFRELADNLSEQGQLEPGIVTHAGMLVNGNTRAVALREIGEGYIRVAVLPNSATEAEYTQLEARLQLAREYKQEYTLTNELLFCPGAD